MEGFRDSKIWHGCLQGCLPYNNSLIYTFVLWDFKGCIIFNHEGLSVGLLYWAAHTLQDHRTSFRGRAAKTTAQNQA